MIKQDISICCADAVSLRATLYQPAVLTKGAIMIAPATGIKRQFYTHFASALAQKGFGVLTFDNRGIGDSLVGDIARSSADLVQWGEYDMPAVLEQLKTSFPSTSYYLIGHSAGGQLIGLMYNCADLSAVFNVAASSGSLRNITGFFWLKARFFMSILIPVANFLLGYTPAQWVGMGEPLPRGVARQWATWCSGSGYVKMALGKEVQQHWFDIFSGHMMWMFAEDDPIAVQPNVEEMMNVFSRARSTMLRIKPEEYARKEIGHMKFFSRATQQLWHLPVDFFLATEAKC